MAFLCHLEAGTKRRMGKSEKAFSQFGWFNCFNSTLISTITEAPMFPHRGFLRALSPGTCIAYHPSLIKGVIH